jgi:hypothetical protein
MRKFCDDERTTTLKFWGFYIFSVDPITYTCFLNVVFMSVRTCPSLKPEQLNEFHSYSVLKTWSIIGRCPLNANIPATNTDAPSGKYCNIFTSLYGVTSLKTIAFMQQNMTIHLGAETQFYTLYMYIFWWWAMGNRQCDSNTSLINHSKSSS